MSVPRVCVCEDVCMHGLCGLFARVHVHVHVHAKKKKDNVGRKSTPYISQGKGGTQGQGMV